MLFAACFADAPPLEETSEGSGSGSTGDATATQGSTMSASTNEVDDTASTIDGTDETTIGGSSADEAAPETSSDTGASPTCGDGNVDAGEDCDDSNTDPGDGCHSDCTVYKRVFVSSEPIDGSMDGLDGADKHCQDAAEAMVWSGSFRAWLSDDAMSAGGRLAGSDLAYRLVDGTLVANNWVDVVDGALVTAIYLDEYGNVPSGAEVWTGTSPNGGISGPSCGSWLLGAETGKVGYIDWSESAQWTDAAVRGCDGFNHLYCFEQ